MIWRSDNEQPRRWKKIGKACRLAPRLLTSPVRVLPDFVIIGAARCGTTSLYDWLSRHPCVAPAFRKEIYFFDRSHRRGLGWYRAFFPTVFEKRYSNRRNGVELITGEATPDYIFHPHAPRRLAQALPRAKLIALLRNPVDRAYSFYHFQLSRRIETLSFDEAIEGEERRLDGELEKMLVDERYFSFARQNYSCLARGVYADQLENWLKHFPRDQILVLSSDDIDSDLAATNTKLMRHLDLPHWQPPQRRRLHATPYSEMQPKTRQRLVDYFRPHNRRLYELLGRDLGWDR